MWTVINANHQVAVIFWSELQITKEKDSFAGLNVTFRSFSLEVTSKFPHFAQRPFYGEVKLWFKPRGKLGRCPTAPWKTLAVDLLAVPVCPLSACRPAPSGSRWCKCYSPRRQRWSGPSPGLRSPPWRPGPGWSRRACWTPGLALCVTRTHAHAHARTHAHAHTHTVI